jgi:hypothetical protein
MTCSLYAMRGEWKGLKNENQWRLRLFARVPFLTSRKHNSAAFA